MTVGQFCLCAPTRSKILGPLDLGETEQKPSNCIKVPGLFSGSAGFLLLVSSARHRGRRWHAGSDGEKFTVGQLCLCAPTCSENRGPLESGETEQEPSPCIKVSGIFSWSAVSSLLESSARHRSRRWHVGLDWEKFTVGQLCQCAPTCSENLGPLESGETEQNRALA